MVHVYVLPFKALIAFTCVTLTGNKEKAASFFFLPLKQSIFHFLHFFASTGLDHIACRQ